MGFFSVDVGIQPGEILRQFRDPGLTLGRCTETFEARKNEIREALGAFLRRVNARPEAEAIEFAPSLEEHLVQAIEEDGHIPSRVARSIMLSVRHETEDLVLTKRTTDAPMRITRGFSVDVLRSRYLTSIEDALVSRRTWFGRNSQHSMVVVRDRLNSLQPEIELRLEEIADRYRRGRHVSGGCWAESQLAPAIGAIPRVGPEQASLLLSDSVHKARSYMQNNCRRCPSSFLAHRAFYGFRNTVMTEVSRRVVPRPSE